ncbi:unnamed protein product, partial [Prorocentrum cordatum]
GLRWSLDDSEVGGAVVWWAWARKAFYEGIETLKKKRADHPDMPLDAGEVIRKLADKQKAAKEFATRVEGAKEGIVEALEVERATLATDINAVMGDGRKLLQSLEIIDDQVLEEKRASYLRDRRQVVK